MKYTPLVTAAAVGLGDGLIENEVKSVKYARLGYEVGAVALGFYFDRTRRHDPNMNYALMTAGTALLFSRLPRAIHSGFSAAYGDVEAAVAAPPGFRVLPTSAAPGLLLGPNGGGGSYGDAGSRFDSGGPQAAGSVA